MPFIHTYQSHGDASIQFGNNTCLFWKMWNACSRKTHTHTHQEYDEKGADSHKCQHFRSIPTDH